MKSKITLFLFIVLNANTVHSGDVYEINKSTLKASGGTTSGSGFEIKGTVGQAEASHLSSGGIYAINGGIWSRDINNDIIFKNGFEN